MMRPKASVMMVTYNHAPFIAQAIESILMQKTDFLYELVIGEDCSTDNTRSVCEEYQRKYPDKIRLLPPEKNLGVCGNGLQAFTACRGEYIAFIEGDDYWTSPHKLQLQIDFLDSNPDFALCYTRDAIVDETSDKQVRPSARIHKDVSTIEDICRECYIMSAAVVFRNNPDIATVFKTGLNSFHWVLLVFVAQYGKIKFIDEVMSVYRCHAGGVYSSKTYVEQLIMNAEAAEVWKKLIGSKCDVEYKETISYYYLEIIKELLRAGRHDLLQEYMSKFALVVTAAPGVIPLLKHHMVDSQSIIAELNRAFAECKNDLEESRKQLSIVYNTKSWKIGKSITFPIRELRSFTRNIIAKASKLRESVVSLAGKIYSWVKSVRKLPRLIAFSLERRRKLIILDDVYPQPMSSFRVVEYNYYLEKIKKSVAYSTGYGFRWLKESRSFEEVLREHVGRYPLLKSKIFKFDENRPLKARLAYFVFLGNAHTFLETLEKYKMPFIFTLYPGGSFALNQQWSDGMLKRVFASPFFRKVIVTQKISYDYLILNKFCDQGSVEFIYGGVFTSDICHSFNVQKKYFKQGKDTLDICFVAHKYTEKGVDKGYDVFIDVAKLLCARFDNINFHVVGPFNENDLDVSEIKDKIKFHGLIKSDLFPAFYSTQDIILSPNIPFAMVPGAFDGFPTGACIEAGLNGVVPFITDPLNQNIKFKDGEDLVIIPHNAGQIMEAIEKYYHDAESLHALSDKTRKSFWEVFNLDAQMKPRIKLIKTYL